MPQAFTLATAELPPFAYLDERQQPKGILIDILDKARQQSGIQITVLVLPWARALNEVKNNHIDALMPVLWTKQRGEFLVYPQQSFYNLSDSVLIKRKDDPFRFQNLASIGRDVLIGRTRLALIGSEFDDLVQNGQLRVYETMKLDEALLMLAQHKVDLVASDKAIARSTIHNLAMEQHFEYISLGFAAPDSYIAFSRQFADQYNIDEIMALINQGQD